MRRPHAPPPLYSTKVSRCPKARSPILRLEVIHLLQMIHPANVDDAQHDLGLGLRMLSSPTASFFTVVDAFGDTRQGAVQRRSNRRRHGQSPKR